MQSVKSKRGLIKFYGVLIFSTLFYSALGLGMCLVFYRDKSLNPKSIFFLGFGILCLCLAIYTILRYFRNSPNIEVDKEKISFNKETFYWRDLSELRLTGKMPFKYLIGFPMEGAMFSFSNGNIKYMFNDVYSNAWQIKSFIQQVVIEKKEWINPIKSSGEPMQLRLVDFNVYRGNQFTSFRGISLWGMIIFIISLPLTQKIKMPPKGFFIFASCFLAFWFYFFSSLMNYFLVSDKFLIVKNHNLFWINKSFPLSRIKEIVFETQGKMPNCLRVITNDFRSVLFPAGTLRDRTWLELQADLETKGIVVRNECIY